MGDEGYLEETPPIHPTRQQILSFPLLINSHIFLINRLVDMSETDQRLEMTVAAPAFNRQLEIPKCSSTPFGVSMPVSQALKVMR